MATNASYALEMGKTSLSGKVTDSLTKEPIFGVTIYIPDLQNGAVTKIDGTYKIDNLPQTKVLLQISCIGYKSLVVTVDLSKTTIQDFVMETSVKEMAQFTITGTSEATEIKRNPAPVSVVDRLTITQNSSTNAIDIIASQPGVSAVTTGPNVSKPFIRGLGYNRVLTLYDGVRQEGQQWGDEHGIEVDETAIDHVEVVKGPESLIYGTDAIAGVVNLLPAGPVPDGTIKGTIVSEYQSNNGLGLISASLYGNNNGFIYGGRISKKEATDYQDPVDGRVFGTKFNETDAAGYIGLIKQWGYSRLNFSVFDDLQEIPDGSRDSATRKFTKQITEADTFRPIVPNNELNDYTIGALHQHVQHYKVYSTNNFIIGDGKLGVTLGAQENIRREFSHPQEPDLAGLYLVLNTFTYDIKYYLPEMKGWATTIGVNGMYQSNKNQGSEFIIPDYNLFDIGPFLYTKKTFKRLDINAGVRYDNRSFTNNHMYTTFNPTTGVYTQVSPSDTAGATRTFSNYNHTFSGASGSFGMTYNFTESFLIKANIARGFRAPNISEISANGVHPGTNIYQVGNPDFKPEFSLQEDVGIFLDTKHVSASIEVFNNEISNYIFNQKILNKEGQDSLDSKGNEFFQFQAAEAELYGGEASIDIHPHPYDWLHFENSLSVVYAVNKGVPGIPVNDSSKYLPFIPPIHTRSELRANIKKKYPHFSGLYIKVDMEWYAAQNRVLLENNTETPTPGYTLYGAGIGGDYTNKKGKTLFSLNISGTNITDVAYQSHLSRLKYFDSVTPSGYAVPAPNGHYGIYNMGRNISFKLTIPLDIKQAKQQSS